MLRVGVLWHVIACSRSMLLLQVLATRIQARHVGMPHRAHPMRIVPTTLICVPSTSAQSDCNMKPDMDSAGCVLPVLHGEKNLNHHGDVHS